MSKGERTRKSHLAWLRGENEIVWISFVAKYMVSFPKANAPTDRKQRWQEPLWSLRPECVFWPCRRTIVRLSVTSEKSDRPSCLAGPGSGGRWLRSPLCTESPACSLPGLCLHCLLCSRKKGNRCEWLEMNEVPGRFLAFPVVPN